VVGAVEMITDDDEL